MAIDEKLIDQLLASRGSSPLELAGENGLLKESTKALVERAMKAELTHHLGYEKHDPAGRHSGNSRNGSSRKKVIGDFGELEVETPRDRNGTFEPKMIAKHQTRWTGFDDRILSMYARGMTTREIQGHLQEIYGVEVSPALVSTVTEEVQDEVRAWQNRPLDEVYPIVYLDALYVKMRDNGHVQNRAVYVAIGINMEGCKEVLGLWTSAHEGAKFWLQVLTEMRNRGIRDIFIACVDGLKGFPEAIEAVFRQTQVQLCVVHLVRHCLNYVSWKQRKEVAQDLRPIYTAPTAEAAALELERFMEKWDKQYPTIGQVWLKNQDRDHSVLRFPGGDQEGNLYDQCGGKPEYEPAQDHQNQRVVPERRGRDSAVVSGAAQSLEEMELCAGLARGAEPVSDSVAGTHAGFGKKIKETERFRKMGALPPCPRDLTLWADPGISIRWCGRLSVRTPVSGLYGARDCGRDDHR